VTLKTTELRPTFWRLGALQIPTSFTRALLITSLFCRAQRVNRSIQQHRDGLIA
jgi:hypothetical protein